MISTKTAISFVPRPSIHPEVYKTFFAVKKNVPNNSAILTWWDYGYAITDATQLATFHDGGWQTTPKTFFIAKGLISSDPDELYDITQFISTEGLLGIYEKQRSSKSLLEAVRNPSRKPWDPIYIFFTADMTSKYGSISKLGSWDIIHGGSKPSWYQNLVCYKIEKEKMNCKGATIDLINGKINNQILLKKLIFVRDGRIIREQDFGNFKGQYLQLIVLGNKIMAVQLINEDVFLSNYNQMFILGRYENDLFEEKFNAFPFARLYKVKF